MGEIARLMTHEMSDEETAALLEDMTPVWTRTPDRSLRSSMERVDRADLRAYLGFLERASDACGRIGSGGDTLAQIARRAEIAEAILRRPARA